MGMLSGYQMIRKDWLVKEYGFVLKSISTFQLKIDRNPPRSVGILVLLCGANDWKQKHFPIQGLVWFCLADLVWLFLLGWLGWFGLVGCGVEADVGQSSASRGIPPIQGPSHSPIVTCHMLAPRTQLLRRHTLLLIWKWGNKHTHIYIFASSVEEAPWHCWSIFQRIERQI